MTEPNDSQEATNLSRDNETQDVSRRDWAKVLGAVLGVGALGACGNQSETTAPDDLGVGAAALVGTNTMWVTSISGLGLPRLTTTSGTSDRQVAIVEGYWTEGDGGGGLFYWDASSTTAPDNGLIIQVQGVATGRWKRIYSGPLNVRWFGAKGQGSLSSLVDPSMDDTNAIAAALKAGKDIQFPSGVYVLTATLTLANSHKIVGAGVNTILKFSGQGPALAYTRAAGEDNSGLMLRDFLIWGTTLAATSAVSLVNPYNCTLNNVSIWGGNSSPGIASSATAFTEAGIKVLSQLTGVLVTNAALVRIEDCTVQYCAGHGCRLVDSTGAAGIYWTRNYIQANSRWGISIESSSAAEVHISEGAIEGNDLGGVQAGNIIGSSIKGVHFESTNQTIPLQILTAPNSYWRSVTVENNNFSCTGSSYAIQLNSSAQSNAILIVGNEISGPTQAGIYLANIDRARVNNQYVTSGPEFIVGTNVTSLQTDKILSSSAPDGITLQKPGHGTFIAANNCYVYTPDGPNYLDAPETQFRLADQSTRTASIQYPPAPNTTSLYLLCFYNGTYTVRSVMIGAANSGGPGLRALSILNS